MYTTNQAPLTGAAAGSRLVHEGQQHRHADQQARVQADREHLQPEGAHLRDPARGHHLDEHLCRRCPRSEEHTSELQSLMRISYAVFCLKKKKNMKNTKKNNKIKEKL